jgi:hypothetical protein
METQPLPEEETTTGGWRIGRVAAAISDLFRIRGWSELPASLDKKPTWVICDRPEDGYRKTHG